MARSNKQNKSQYLFEQTWQVHGYSMLSMDLGVVFPFSTMKHWLCSFVDKNWFFTFENNVGSMYYSKQEMELAGYWGRKDFLDNIWFSAYIQNSQKLYSQAEKLFRKYSDTEIVRADKETLYKMVREMGLLLTDLYGYFNACQPQCVSHLERDLEQEISKVAPKEKVRELMLELTRPEARTFLDEEEIKWLQICSQKHANLKNVLEIHSEKFGILGTSDGGSYYTVDYYEKLYKKRDEEELRSKLVRKLAQEKSIKEEKRNLIVRYKISDHAQKLAEILSLAGHERFEIRLRGWMLIDYWFTNNLLPNLEKSFGIEICFAKQFTFQELLQFILTGEYDLTELKKRDEYFVIGMKDGRVFLQTGNEGRVYAKELLPDFSKHENELKGQIAKMGFVRGKAFVFHWNTKDVVREMEKMPKGSILVAGQTRPQLMPVIRKSSAIITDEGGITSHAAIVSRELGIPCVIGTKVATKIIKTGDLIEVDANEGMVRIINKNEQSKSKDKIDNSLYAFLEQAEDWMKIMSRKTAVFYDELALISTQAIMPTQIAPWRKESFTIYPLQLMISESASTTIYYNKDSWRLLKAEINKEFLEGKYKAEFRKTIFKQIRDASNLVQRSASSVSSSRPQKFCSQLKVIYDAIILSKAIVFFAADIVSVLSQDLKDYVQEVVPGRQIDKWFEVLASYPQLTTSDKARRAWLEIAITAKRDYACNLSHPKITKHLQSYINKYSFITFKGVDDPKSSQDYLKELNQLVSDNTIKTLEKELLYVKEIKQKNKILQGEFIKKYSPPSKIRELIKVVQFFSYIFNEDAFAAYQFNLNFLNRLAQHMELSRQEFVQLTYAEMLGATKTPITIKRFVPKIMERNNRVMIYKDGNVQTFYGHEIVQKSSKIVQEKNRASESEETELIKGLSACKGSAVGHARIVRDPSKSKFNKGDILVVEDLNVNFAPLLRNSSALISDTGSLLSHEAIIAREYGIPGIVGTKNATKKIKNGDLVEVDANQGIVRIIERTNSDNAISKSQE